MTTLRTLCGLSLVSMGLSAGAVDVHAQARSDVYFTGPDNVISRVTSFADGTSVAVVDEGGTNLRGLVARDDGASVVTLVATNKTQSGDVRAYRCPAGANLSAGSGCANLGPIIHLKEAAGASLDTEGSIWAVNADPGGEDLLAFVPRDPACDGVSSASCHPAGYRTDQSIIAPVPGASLLADVLAVPGADGADYGQYQANDVLVLVTSPSPAIVRHRPGQGDAVVASDFDGAQPTGLAFYPPTGQLLVTTDEGRILVIEPLDGGLQPIDFAVLGGQGVHLSVGFDEDASEDPYLVFATYTNGGRVVALRATTVQGALQASGGPLGTVTTNNPWGVGNATLSAAVFTPASGTPVTVSLPVGHQILFETTEEGLTRGAQPRIVPEAKVRRPCPPPASGSPDDDATCGGQLTIDGVTRLVPPHVHGLPFGGSTECPDFENGCYLVHIPDSDADAFGSTQQHHFDEERFGVDPGTVPCYVEELQGNGRKKKLVNAPAPQQPRVFYATDADDPRVIEGDEFFDTTTGCGSPFARGWQFSFFLTGWSGWTPEQTATFQLERLLEAIQTGAQPNDEGGLALYIGDATREALIDAAGTAIRFNSRGNTRKTLDALESVVSITRDAGAVFYECGPTGTDECRNAPGELVARAESASFFVCGASEDCQKLLSPQ